MSAETTAPSMTVRLPKAVQNQVDNLNRIEAELKEKFAEKTPSGNQVVQPQVTSPEPVKAAEAPVQPQTETKTEEHKDARYWEHRFKTLQGMSEAEKTRLKNHISGLESRLVELEDTVKRVKSQPSNSPVDLTKYLSQEEIDTYGADVIKAVVKAAKAAADEESGQKMKDELNRQLNPIKEKLNATEVELQTRLEDQFWDELNKKFPKWIEVNENPKWLEWLAQRDPLSGVHRQDLLNSAQKNKDSDRVVAMFTAFTQSSPAPQPVTNKQQQVVPDPVAAPSTLAPSVDARPMTGAEIKKFYSDVAMGKYRFRPQEKEAIEKRINAMMRKG